MVIKTPCEIGSHKGQNGELFAAIR